MSKSRNGYYYPQSDQASAVLDVLKMRLKHLGAEIKTNTHVKSIKHTDGMFSVKTENDTILADKVILACGGKAAPKLGSDGSGYSLARSLGHSIVPVVPALVQLKVKNNPLVKAAGVRCEAKVAIYADGGFLGEDTGELQITAYGISGIPVFQVSRHAAKGLYDKREVHAVIDFLPAFSKEECIAFLEQRKSGRERLTVSEFLIGIFNRKLIPCILKNAGIRFDVAIASLDTNRVKNLAYVIKHMELEIESDNGFENAQVCAGGVCLTEICPDTMESLHKKGLYFCGELLDVDGICGGYNLQWAWASGYLAGLSAAEAAVK